MPRFALLILFLFAGGHIYAQDYDNAVKLGMLRNGQGYYIGLLAYERALGEKISIQPEFGFRPWKLVGSGNRPYNLYAFHVGIEARYHFALRRNLKLSGFFAGPYLAYDRMLWNDPETSFSFVRRYWSSIGISMGYQHAFGDRFRIDGGVKLGYGGELFQDTYHLDGALHGTLQSTTVYGNFATGFVFLQGAFLF